MKTRKQNGFTIVELLIVVVVIAILAAITLVTYNGIQQRAQNTQFLSAFDTYEKALRLYKITYGEYPRAVNGGGLGVYSCLGGNYPATSNLAADQCFKSGGLVLGEKVSAVDVELRKVVNQLPALNYPLLSDTDADSGIVTQSRGIMFQSELPPNAILFYFTTGDAPCGRGVKVYDAVANTSSCRIDLP